MTTTDTTSRKVDETLARFRELQVQFERVRDRLRKAEEQRNTVSRRTFDKVRAEYDRELDALRAKMSPLREELESHRVTVESALRDASAALELLEEDLAEVLFRHRVGEFSDTEMTERRRAVEARLDAARARIADRRHTLEQFETMAESESAAETPAHDTDPHRETVAPAARAEAKARVAVPEKTREDASQARGDEPASVRRPMLRRGPATPSPLSVRAVRESPPVKLAATDQDSPGFENPHDWIKEMGPEVASSRREPQPAVRPRPTATTPSAPRSAAPDASPRGPARMPSLVFVNGAHAGQSVPLLPTTLTIGREHDNNIELKDPDVARYHARIVHERGNYVVEDLDSTTGTWVNGQRTRKASLNHGDVVRVGSTEIAIDFEWASDPV